MANHGKLIQIFVQNFNFPDRFLENSSNFNFNFPVMSATDFWKFQFLYIIGWSRPVAGKVIHINFGWGFQESEMPGNFPKGPRCVNRHRNSTYTVNLSVDSKKDLTGLVWEWFRGKDSIQSSLLYLEQFMFFSWSVFCLRHCSCPAIFTLKFWLIFKNKKYGSNSIYTMWDRLWAIVYGRVDSMKKKISFWKLFP